MSEEQKLVLPAMDAKKLDWRHIDLAPRDGTAFWLRNRVMQQPVQGRWGQYSSPWGNKGYEWVLTADPLERYMPMARGALIIPDEFAPIAPTLKATDHG